MKKLLLICVLFLSLASLGQTSNQQDVRPYLHWQIEFVKFNEETNTVTQGTVLIEAVYLKDAVTAFETQCSYCQIRAAFRHYYYSYCQERSY